MKYLTLIFVLSASILSLSSNVAACVCDTPSTIPVAFKESAAVFKGRYVGGEFKKGIKDEMTELHLETMGQKSDYEMFVLKFEVDEWFKGQKGGEYTVELVTSNARLPDGTETVSDCGLGFEKAKSYLVYAYSDKEGNLSSGACTRTKSVARAGTEMRELRKLAKSDESGAAHFQPFSFLNLFTTISLRSLGKWSMNSFPSQWSVSCMNARAA